MKAGVESRVADCKLVSAANGDASAGGSGGERAPNEGDSGFAVHWLQNKEFAFTAAAERLLADTLLAEHGEGGARSGATSVDLPSPLGGGSIDGAASGGATADALTPTGGGVDTLAPSAAMNSLSMGGETTRDFFDHKLEGLVRTWNRSSDVLFSVHPQDGSLLIWLVGWRCSRRECATPWRCRTVEWLDDEWRQAVISFATCLAHALPFTDAAPLNCALCVFSREQAARVLCVSS